MALTDKQLQAAVKAGQPIAGLSDGDGLTFTVSNAGTASFVLRYRADGKRKELTLGRYPTLTLKAARELATQHRANLYRGIDAVEEKRQEKLEAKADSLTFEKVANEALQSSAAKLAPATIQGRRQQLNTYVFPFIGKTPIRQVTTEQLSEVIRATVAKSPHVGRLVMIALRTVFAHAIATGQLQQRNPCADLKITAFLTEKPSPRQRLKLTESELRHLFKGLPGYGKQNELTILLLLATGTRIGELTSARWEHIDVEKRLWTIPAPKNRKPFTIPLTDTAIGWFRELQTLAFGSSYVLPVKLRRAGKPTDRHMPKTSLNEVTNRIHSQNAENIRRFTPHDLRSTVRSLLTDDLDVPLDIAERCLNHYLGSALVGVYDKSDYIVKRRHALEKLEHYFNTLRADQPWKVIQFKQSA